VYLIIGLKIHLIPQIICLRDIRNILLKASDDNEFKLLMWSDNWNAGWGSGYWFNSWNTVWNVDYSTSLANAVVKNFGSNQYMSIVTSTSLSAVTQNSGY